MKGHHALSLYLAADRPPACPRCGSWGGPRLPNCTKEGWSHHESCALIRYAEDVCLACEDQLDKEAMDETTNFAIETLRSRREHLMNGGEAGLDGPAGLRAQVERAEATYLHLRTKMEEQAYAVNQIDEALDLLSEVEP